MKTAIVSRSALALAVNTVKDVIDRKSTVPALSNVRIAAIDGNLVAIGTDLDIQTTVTIDAGAIDAGFDTTIPAHSLADILKKAPSGDDLAIDYTDMPEPDMRHDGTIPARESRAELDFAGLRVKVGGIAGSEFPEMAIDGKVIEWDMPTTDLRAALLAVEFAISTEETRYYLNGIYMHMPEPGMLRMVATDGHRLGKHDVNIPYTGDAIPGVIIPRKTVGHLLKVTGKGAPETTRVIVNTVKARFIVGNVDIITKLIDGTFPDYHRVMPTAFAMEAKFDRAKLIEAVKAVSCISSERGRAIKLSFEADKCTLSVNNPDLGNASFTIPVDGAGLQGFEVGINTRYLLDILQQEQSEHVETKFQDSGAPMKFEGRTEYVLMPMRV